MHRSLDAGFPGPSMPTLVVLPTLCLVMSLMYAQAGQAQSTGEHTSRKQLNPSYVTVTAADGVVVHGDVYERDSDTTILLFHQGGSNARGEYGPIIPQLLDEGYRVAAFDLRLGGQWHGSWNRTVADYPNAESYCEAEPDIEAVVAFAKDRWSSSKLVLWGSSYSATLVIRQAGRDADGVAAVLAFSPASGDPMEGCRPESFLSRVDVRMFVLRPPHEAQNPAVREQLRLVEEAGHVAWVPKYGAHGSSMLVVDRVGGHSDDDVRVAVEATWARVLEFLEETVR